MHRPAAVRIEQELDGLAAPRTYGEAGDRQARELAHQQAETIARLTTTPSSWPKTPAGAAGR